MNPQLFIESKLQELRTPLGSFPQLSADELVGRITSLLLSKKFRKYSADSATVAHVHEAVRLSVEKNQPINLVYVHGGYKLWRLEEAPECDWAEVFSLMHYTRWVKAICELYEPGVWFDFFVDDLIVPKLDNITLRDVRAYLSSYQAIMDFLKPYQPENLRMTITTVGSQFSSEEAFATSLQQNIEAYAAELPGGLPELNEAQNAMVELNTKVTDEQRADPKWREKVMLIHNAYSRTKSEPGYHKRPDKILVFTTPIPGSLNIALGTTKDSIAKFWVGVGALKPRDEEYRMVILSPNQLAAARFHREAVNVGLAGKNFSSVRVVD